MLKYFYFIAGFYACERKLTLPNRLVVGRRSLEAKTGVRVPVRQLIMFKYIQSPLFFKLQKGERILFWLGIQHSSDPKHPQHVFIKEKWQEFTKEAKYPLAVVEHPLHVQEVHDIEEEAIINGGEVEFTGFLAKQIGAPVACFESDRHDEMNHLAQLFGKEKTEYYYFARVVAQWYRLKVHIPLEQYITSFLKRDADASDWIDFEFTIPHLENIHKTLFGSELDFSDKNQFLKTEDPTREDNSLREVVRACGEYRNKAIVNGVKQAWEKNDIFIV